MLGQKRPFARRNAHLSRTLAELFYSYAYSEFIAWINIFRDLSLLYKHSNHDTPLLQNGTDTAGSMGKAQSSFKLSSRPRAASFVFGRHRVQTSTRKPDTTNEIFCEFH